MFPGEWTPDPPRPDTAEITLHDAALSGDMHNVLRLLDQGVSPNTKGGVYGTPLQAACLGGHEEVAFMLLYEGADVNARGGRHGDALRAACFGGHEKVVELLIDHGARIDVPERYGSLYVACEAGHLKVVRLLLGKGVDWRTQRGRLGNVLDIALHYQDERLERMLREAGAVPPMRKESATDEEAVEPPTMGPRPGFTITRTQPLQPGHKGHSQGGWMDVILQIYFHINPLRKAFHEVLSGQSRRRKLANAPRGLSISQGKGSHSEKLGPRHIHQLEDELLALLTKQFEDNAIEHTVSSLFKIHSKLYDASLISDTSVHCKEEDWHLKVQVRNSRSLEEYFEDLIQPQYSREDARVHGGMFYLGTEKGRIFEEFPPVLSVQLQRDHNDYFEYPEKIDLSPYLSPESDRFESWFYTLLGVVVCEGKEKGSLYCGYLRKSDGSFFKYSDKTVKPATLEEVLRENYGGDHGCSESGPKYRNACILYYCRKCKMGDILVDTSKDGSSGCLDEGLESRLCNSIFYSGRPLSGYGN